MTTYNVHEAKTHFSKLIDKAATGEEVVIAKAGKVMVKLVPANANKPRIRFGLLEGHLPIPEDFDAPDAAIEALFNGTD